MNNIQSKLFFGTIAFAAFVGCGGTGGSSSEADPIGTANEAVTDIASCRAAHQACTAKAGDADKTTCEADLKTCLGAVAAAHAQPVCPPADGGAPKPVERDGGPLHVAAAVGPVGDAGRAGAGAAAPKAGGGAGAGAAAGGGAGAKAAAGAAAGGKGAAAGDDANGGDGDADDKGLGDGGAPKPPVGTGTGTGARTGTGTDTGTGADVGGPCGRPKRAPDAAVEACITAIDNCLKAGKPADTCAAAAIACLEKAAPRRVGGNPVAGGPPKGGPGPVEKDGGAPKPAVDAGK